MLEISEDKLYKVIKENNAAEVNRILQCHRLQEYMIKQGFDLAYDRRSYESLECFMNTHKMVWREDCDNMLETELILGDYKLCKILVDGFTRRGCPGIRSQMRLGQLLLDSLNTRNLDKIYAILGSSTIDKVLQRYILIETFKGRTITDMLADVFTSMLKDVLKMRDVNDRTDAIRTLPDINFFISIGENVFENVKRLIQMGFGVNKYRNRTFIFDQHLCQHAQFARNQPFYVALQNRRSDVMKLLLVNGAQPLRAYQANYETLMSRADTRLILYLILTCNASISVSSMEVSFFKYLLEEINFPSSSRYTTDHRYPRHIRRKPFNLSCTKVLLILLDKTEIFSDRDRRALLAYNLSESADEEIKQKIHETFYQPRKLSDICRHRIHRHFGYNFRRFISFLKEKNYPKLIISYLEFHDVLKKHFGEQELEDLKGQIGFLTNDCFIRKYDYTRCRCLSD